MKLFDSHCHLDDRSYESELDAVIERARAAGVTAVMAVGIDEPSSLRVVEISDRYSGVFAAVGVHPHDARGCSDAILHRLEQAADHPKVRAWGETGLDYNRMFSPRDAQEKWFLRQLEIAGETGLPLIFHERDSGGRFLALLRESGWNGLEGVVHCFSGSPTELDAYLDLGLHIGITGILTVKGRGAGLRELVKRIPADRLLVETDAPYLTPVPERNKHRRNEPAFVQSTFLKLAEVRGDDPARLAARIWTNTCRLFRIEESDLAEVAG
ncbi:MAG: TatD family hydrolase [Desulfobacterales bacterium]